MDPPPDDTGERQCIMQAAISLPRINNSMVSEAAGLAYGLQLLLEGAARFLQITIMGDNLPIVRLGATNARVRDDEIWKEVEKALMDLSYTRWPARWWAVRRYLNKAADDLATKGVMSALRDRTQGRKGDTIIIWGDEELLKKWNISIPTSIEGRRDLLLTRSLRPICNTRLFR